MKLDIPTDKTLVHEMVMPVRWGDMDAFSHVNNTVYFRYLESARIDWLYQLQRAVPPSSSIADQGPVVVNTFCNFYLQITFPANLLIKSYVSNIGRSSFDCWYEIWDHEEPTRLYSDGGATTVWVDRLEQKSIPLPPALLSHMKTLMLK